MNEQAKRVASAWHGPRSLCTCGHTGDMTPTETRDTNPLCDHAGVAGHGHCYFQGCPCQKFVWASWTGVFADALAVVAVESAPAIREGLFVLDETIINPSPDRRTRGDQWLKASEWTAGTRFTIVRSAHDSGRVFYNVRSVDEAYADAVAFYEKDGCVAVSDYHSEALSTALLYLVAHLRPSTAPLAPLQWLFYQHHETPRNGAWSVLSRLLLMGKVSVQDAREALEAEDAADDVAKTASEEV